MQTVVLKVDSSRPEPDPVRRAADVLRAGGLVAFPTETVYGLGANALSAAAAARIFKAKGRPSTNPLIVHVADPSEVLSVAAAWPATARLLAARFWPGPLTLVVPKRAGVPDVVTAGGDTVAVRCPNHAVARALIRQAGVPLAAPSANRSTELSPTRAAHVLKGLNGRIELLLDGGPCPGGLESTVVDVTGDVPRVLRPGLIARPMLEAVCGRVEAGATGEGVARAPGHMAKHYSPRTPVVLVDAHERALALGAEFARQKLSWGWLALGEHPGEAFAAVPMPLDADEYAARLYRELHSFDERALDRIIVELPPDAPEWAAVRDRLTRAAAGG
ncbi:MAG: L-threonylcarbamoyladenylate synthase [Gemmata sp.]